MQVTLQACEQGVREADRCSRHPRRAIDVLTLPAQSWEALDAIHFVRSVPEPILSVSVLPFPIPVTLQARSPNSTARATRCRDGRGRPEGDQSVEIVHSLALHVVAPTAGQSQESKDKFRARLDKFGDGQRGELLEEAHRSTNVKVPRSSPVDSAERRAEATVRKVTLSEVSRARQCLTGQRGHLELKRIFNTCRADGCRSQQGPSLRR